MINKLDNWQYSTCASIVKKTKFNSEKAKLLAKYVKKVEARLNEQVKK